MSSNKRKAPESDSETNFVANKRIKTDSNLGLADLPDDVIFHILLFVSINDFGSIVQVKKQWNKIISGQRYWQARSEVIWSDISVMDLKNDFVAYFRVKYAVEGQPNFLWDKYCCLRSLYEGIIPTKDGDIFDSLTKTEFSKNILARVIIVRFDIQKKLLHELLEYLFTHDPSYAGKAMVFMDAALADDPMQFSFGRKLINICSKIFPKMEVCEDNSLSYTKINAISIAWDGLHPTLGKPTQDNIAFFGELLETAMKFVVRDFQPRALPSFASFKLHDDENEVSLDSVCGVYELLQDHFTIRRVDEYFYRFLTETIISEYAQAKDNFKRKLSAIYARQLLPKPFTEFGQYAAKLLPLLFDAMNSTEPELAFAGCTNFIDIIFENNLPEVLDVDQIIKCLTKLIELAEQLPLSFAIWIIPSFVKILNPEKSVGVSDELLKSINDRILNLISQHHPQTCKAIHCLGDLARSFGSRFTPYLPRYKEALFALSPVPEHVHPDNIHERVVDQYVDLACKSNNTSEAAEMISNIMSLTTDDYDLKFLHGYNGLRNAILVHDKPEWVDRIIDSVLSIYRFDVLHSEEIDLVRLDQLKWLPRTEKEWINARKEISDAISRNETYPKHAAEPMDGTYTPPDEYNENELELVGTKGRMAILTLTGLAKKFGQNFSKYYPEALNTLKGLLKRDFPTYEHEDYILDLLEFLIGDPVNKKVICKEGGSIMTCLECLLQNNPARVAPLFDKVYNILTTTLLTRYEIEPMIYYLSDVGDFAKLSELVRNYPLETRLAINITEGGYLLKYFSSFLKKDYTAELVSLAMLISVHFGLRVFLEDALSSQPSSTSRFYPELKSWANREDYLDLPYAKKFAVLVAALEVDERMIDFCEYSMASEFDWSIFVEALSSDTFDTLNEELNALVKNSDKSVKFWMSLE